MNDEKKTLLPLALTYLNRGWSVIPVGLDKIPVISWKEFQKIVGDKWTPGLSKPFDPRASKLAASLKIKVAMINGKNLDRLEDFLNNRPFIGTTIQ